MTEISVWASEYVRLEASLLGLVMLSATAKTVTGAAGDRSAVGRLELNPHPPERPGCPRTQLPENGERMFCLFVSSGTVSSGRGPVSKLLGSSLLLS